VYRQAVLSQLYIDVYIISRLHWMNSELYVKETRQPHSSPQPPTEEIKALADLSSCYLTVSPLQWLEYNLYKWLVTFYFKSHLRQPDLYFRFHIISVTCKWVLAILINKYTIALTVHLWSCHPLSFPSFYYSLLLYVYIYLRIRFQPYSRFSRFKQHTLLFF